MRAEALAAGMSHALQNNNHDRYTAGGLTMCIPGQQALVLPQEPRDQCLLADAASCHSVPPAQSANGVEREMNTVHIQRRHCVGISRVTVRMACIAMLELTS